MIEKFKKNYSLIINVVAIIACALLVPAICGLLEVVFSSAVTEGSYIILIKYACLFIASLVLALSAFKKNTNVIIPLLLFFAGNMVEDIYLLTKDFGANNVIYLLLYVSSIIAVLILNYNKNEANKGKCLYFVYVVMLINSAFYLTSTFSGSSVGLSQLLSMLGFMGMIYIDNYKEEN